MLIALDNLDQNTMRPGLSARIVIRREAQQNALLAPRAALDLSDKTAHAKLASGKTVAVQLGSCNAQECVVKSGLAEGQLLAPVVEVKRGS